MQGSNQEWKKIERAYFLSFINWESFEMKVSCTFSETMDPFFDFDSLTLVGAFDFIIGK